MTVYIKYVFAHFVCSIVCLPYLFLFLPDIQRVPRSVLVLVISISLPTVLLFLLFVIKKTVNTVLFSSTIIVKISTGVLL